MLLFPSLIPRKAESATDGRVVCTHARKMERPLLAVDFSPRAIARLSPAPGTDSSHFNDTNEATIFFSSRTVVAVAQS